MIQAKTILKVLPNVLRQTEFSNLSMDVYRGKVRDIYVVGDRRIQITTDRQSAFDVVLGHIPFKGAVLNLLSEFWFKRTRHIIQNHMISVPDPNVMIVKKCQTLPIEIVVRGHLTGVTNTSIWTSYKNGERKIYGIDFPDGLKKNQPLPKIIITPTTKGDLGKHDERLTREEILSQKIIDKKLLEQIEQVSLSLYKYASKLCKNRGLILDDSKFEFGTLDGRLILIDEIFTPDSSRFWLAKTYPAKFARGEEPDHFDKEFLRLWYTKKGFTGNGIPPKMTKGLITELSQRYITAYEMITGRQFKEFDYPIEKRIEMNLAPKMTYSNVGDNYSTKDPIKKLAQASARKTGVNLKKNGFLEVESSRGESAFVWKQGNVHMASVVEGLGTKNLVADGMRKITKKTYYDVLGHDAVATIVNDLTSSGATPLVVHAYWAIENNDWLLDKKRTRDLIAGWKSACDLAGATWGGGETPTLKGIITSGTIELGGAATGIIKNKKQLITDGNLKNGDRIILIKSSGINANGLSLARAIAEKLPHGWATKMASGKMFGEAILSKTNIYASLVTKLFKQGIFPHYISNVTGHGLRKVMRSQKKFSYILEEVFKPQELFTFIQEKAKLSDYEMYETFNMGQDYALFVSKEDVAKTLKIIQQCGFRGIEAGFVAKGEKQVEIRPRNIVFDAKSLDLR